MKILICTLVLLFCQFALTQNKIELPEFHSIESHLEATIQIKKSKEYRIEISNKHNDFLEWRIANSRLKLTINDNPENLDLKGIKLTIYAPNIKELIVTQKGNISMDSRFSKINSLSVLAENGANIDLSNIVFNTLIIYKDSESDIIYDSVNTLINNKKPYKY